jgi:C4-type Zn-finger protein
MKFAVRRPAAEAPRVSTTHRCPQCHQEALILQRRHVSPPHLGASLVTEYYECDYCEARYQYSPADDRWKPIS